MGSVYIYIYRERERISERYFYFSLEEKLSVYSLLSVSVIEKDKCSLVMLPFNTGEAATFGQTNMNKFHFFRNFSF